MESASDVEVNTKVLELITKIQLALEKLENSSFYTEFMKQVQNPEMIALIEKVIATDPDHSQLQVVLYGVGRIEPNEKTDVEPNHMQLCLAILLRNKFEWVHDIVVYDPVLSTVEQNAINAFNCNCLSVNENGRRTVNRPTLFFMPHCDITLMDSVLEANWTPENLNKIIILGNSLKGYDLDKGKFEYYHLTNKIQVILDSDHMLHEMPLPQKTISLDRTRHFLVESLYEKSFHDLSWHFFDWDGSLHGFRRQDPKLFAYIEEERIKKRKIYMIEKIHLAREKLEKSSFYEKFMAQMHDPEMITRIENVIRTDPHHSKLQVVFHGNGMAKPNNHMQIAFAILLREKFHWVNDIVMYDPFLSTLEKSALQALNCSFLCGNKDGILSVDRPTLFFMPCSQMFQCINLLEANWTPAKLNKIIILGQSFKQFTERYGTSKSKAIINNEQILYEMPLPETAIKIPCSGNRQDGSTSPKEDYSVDPDPVYTEAFNGLCWHFLSWDRLFDDVRSFFGWDLRLVLLSAKTHLLSLKNLSQE